MNKVLLLTTRNPNAQGDYLELSLVHGLRGLLGEDFVEYPKKKILYGDFSDSPKDKLHGKGFTLCSDPIKDVSYNRDKLSVRDFDVVIHGSGFIYGDMWEVTHPNQFWTDGNDLYGNAKRKTIYDGEEVIASQYTERCFKRELVEELPTVWPIGFGIPASKIKQWGFEGRRKLFQQTAPSQACFYEISGNKFNVEDSYYLDMGSSWFGLTCKKGGWDCLRHYEILASGALLLFRDFDKKPPLCPPIDLPTLSYSSKDELDEIVNRLIENNIPSSEYIDLLQRQREWLMCYGTTIARATQMMKIIDNSGK